jgi:transposase
VRYARLWARLVGVEKAVVERVVFDEDEGVVVVSVRPAWGQRRRCGVCRWRVPGYDQGQGRRRWRALDLGRVRVFVEADAPRVCCPRHGIVVAAVPWARHGAGHTFAFDEQVAWLATQCSKTAVTRLMRVSWRTVGAIVARVWADVDGLVDRLAGLRRIGIDEISWKKGHKYLTVVVCHDSGRLVWASSGRDRATLRAFFGALGPARSAQITHISADGADWIADVVARQCPAAVVCADPFHVVSWATDALDQVRRQAWNLARHAVGGSRRHVQGPGRATQRAVGAARTLKRCRWALWKNPDTLTEQQTVKLAWIAKTSPMLYRAYLLKEGLRAVFQIAKVNPDDAVVALDRWTSWARRSRISAFVTLQRRITAHRTAILAAINHGLSNGRIESMNTKIRLITRMAFGFHSADALIALAMLSLGGHRPTLHDR